MAYNGERINAVVTNGNMVEVLFENRYTTLPSVVGYMTISDLKEFANWVLDLGEEEVI